MRRLCAPPGLRTRRALRAFRAVRGLAACGTAWLDLLLPRACARCGAHVEGDAVLCRLCARGLPRLPRDGAPRAPAPLTTWEAEVAYAGEVEQWIHRFKYPRPGLAGLDARPAALLAALATDAAARIPPPRPRLVVPVPIHPRRHRARGFHPAGVLAEAVAHALAGRCVPDALATTRETASQTGLDRAARRRNVRGAFAPRPGFVAERAVVLVDDVVTTGATLAACARALRRAGAREIHAVCVARKL